MVVVNLVAVTVTMAMVVVVVVAKLRDIREVFVT